MVEKNGEYVISLKGNQGRLHEDVKSYFADDHTEILTSLDIDAGHGRIETRSIRLNTNTQWLNDKYPAWATINSIAEVTSTRETKNKITTEKRYFISSHTELGPARIAGIIRHHWAIENSLHWVLDVAFNEDQNRTRSGNSAANLSMIRHLAVNLVTHEKTSKVGVKTKRAMAGWSNDYMLKVMRVI